MKCQRNDGQVEAVAPARRVVSRTLLQVKPKTRSDDRFLHRWKRLRPRAPLDIHEILIWIEAYHHRHGRWPTIYSGKIRGSLHETWSNVDAALKLGLRGLEGGSSLAGGEMEHHQFPATKGATRTPRPGHACSTHRPPPTHLENP